MRLMNMDRCPYPAPVSIVCDQDLERGLFLEIKGMAKNNLWLDNADDFEAYQVALATANTAKGDLLIHSSVPFSYDERDMEQDFVLKAGNVGRGHYIKSGDEITIAKDLVGEVVVEDEVILGADGKLTKGTGNALGIVKKVYDFNGQESVLIRFY